MLFQILKKDLLKRKGINVILFIFITLATVFLASSVNNILVVSNSIDYYLEYANVPDIDVLVNSELEKTQHQEFMDKMVEENIIDTYAYEHMLIMNDKTIYMNKGNENIPLNSDGLSMYIGKNNLDYASVYDENAQTFTIEDGEIALAVDLMDKNDLHIGDSIILKVNREDKAFIIKQKMKDAVFGNGMSGMNRMIVSDNDFHDMTSSMEYFGLYHVVSDQVQTFLEKLSSEKFTTIMNSATRDMYFLIYSFDLIMAGLLTVIGICLILIALLVLRFTLVFTMEEQYQEIGILKAIGFRNFAIKKLYLMKYLVIVSVGAALGCILSLPISSIMVDSISVNMILESSTANMSVNILCAFIIVLLVLGFCYFCTRKLNKISAINAIRSGQNGERYHKLRGMRLSLRKHMPVSVYLGMNDIATHLRRYIVLIITFCISFILITIPLNTLNTMASPEMAKKFMLNPESSVYLRSIESPDENKYSSLKEVEEGLKRIDLELSEKGYHASFTPIPLYFISFSSQEDSASFNVLATQLSQQQLDMKYLDYDEGNAPLLENEVALSKGVLKEHGWSVGDTVYGVVSGISYKFLITGSYTDYMQLGKSARINPIIDTSKDTMFDYWAIMVDMNSELSQIELANVLSEEFPDYEWKSAQELIDQNVGGIKGALEQLVMPMTAMLCGIIMLITLLMERLFITREKGEIAMMKSCGFSYKSIRLWQLVRMVCVVGSAMLISVPLSTISNTFILRPIFAIMGADVMIQVDPLQVYLIYPGILLTGIMIATLFATRSIHKIDIKDMNNLE